jgi:hypothetical protein
LYPDIGKKSPKSQKSRANRSQVKKLKKNFNLKIRFKIRKLTITIGNLLFIFWPIGSAEKPFVFVMQCPKFQLFRE